MGRHRMSSHALSPGATATVTLAALWFRFPRVFLVLAALILSGCQATAPQGEPFFQSTTRPLLTLGPEHLVLRVNRDDRDWFENVAWLPGAGRLVAVYTPPDGRAYDLHLVTFLPNGSHLTRLPLPSDPDCARVSQHFPRVLPDGRLAYIQRCWVSQTSARKVPEESTTLMVYDPKTGTTERLVPWPPYRTYVLEREPCRS